MAEAAVVLPIIIFAVITTVLIVMFFYDQSVNQSRMHMALRCEAGLISERSMTYDESQQPLAPDAIWSGSITSSGSTLSGTVHGSDNVSMITSGILRDPQQAEIRGHVHIADPAAAVRARSIIGDR